MAARGVFGLVSLILVAGALVFMFFILLAGAVDGNPVNKFYFLQADTSNIANAPAVSRWTYWNVCAVQNGRDVCGGSGYSNVIPARPLDPPRNFNTINGVPAQFINTHYYFLMTRFMFAFMLISLFFAVCALFTGLLALCSRIGSYLSGLLTTLAFVFQALNAALMTAAYVKGRNAFRSNGMAASIGNYAFGFEWAAFACLFLSTILFCLGGSSKDKTDYAASKTSSRRGFFGRGSKSTRSRGSFVADKEYA